MNTPLRHKPLSRNVAVGVGLVLLSGLLGCANYEYAVVGPDGTTMAVKEDEDLVVPARPAELRFREFSDRCVMMIENPTTQPITLVGDDSAVVDPRQQSRVLAGQLIPPGAFVKLVFPPLRDDEPRGPRIGIGLGVGMQVHAGDLPTAPRKSLMLRIDRAMEHWDWSGEGAVRVLLTFKQDAQVTRHELTIRRTKK